MNAPDDLLREPEDPAGDKTTEPAVSGQHEVTRLSFEEAGVYLTMGGFFCVIGSLAMTALCSIVIWLQDGYYPYFSLRKFLVWRGLGVALNRYDWSQDVPVDPPITEWVGVQKIVDFVLDMHLGVHAVVVGIALGFLGAGIGIAGIKAKESCQTKLR